MKSKVFANHEKRWLLDFKCKLFRKPMGTPQDRIVFRINKSDETLNAYFDTRHPDELQQQDWLIRPDKSDITPIEWKL